MKTTSIKLGIAAMLLCVGTACNASAETEIKTIDIKALNGEDVKVIVLNSDELHRIELEIEDIENNPVLLEKLRNLEPEIQKTVLEALRSLNDDDVFTHLPSEFSEGLGKVIVIKTADGQTIEANLEGNRISQLLGDDNILDDKTFVFKTSKMMLKGHSNVIIKMLEKGDFDREKLDEIQAALDAKR
jgi:hypothetical protein